jgi:hypothetical protein
MRVQVRDRWSTARIAAVLTAAVLTGALAGPPGEAGATEAVGSIVFMKDFNVWIMPADDPDAARPVTTDGTAEVPYTWPTQDDTGTIMAFHGPPSSALETLVRMDQHGNLLRAPIPLGREGSRTHLTLSPDGRYAAFTLVGQGFYWPYPMVSGTHVMAADGDGGAVSPAGISAMDPHGWVAPRSSWPRTTPSGPTGSAMTRRRSGSSTAASAPRTSCVPTVLQWTAPAAASRPPAATPPTSCTSGSSTAHRQPSPHRCATPKLGAGRSHGRRGRPMGTASCSTSTSTRTRPSGLYRMSGLRHREAVRSSSTAWSSSPSTPSSRSGALAPMSPAAGQPQPAPNPAARTAACAPAAQSDAISDSPHPWSGVSSGWRAPSAPRRPLPSPRPRSPRPIRCSCPPRRTSRTRWPAARWRHAPGARSC